jgi:hypothetical protein
MTRNLKMASAMFAEKFGSLSTFYSANSQNPKSYNSSLFLLITSAISSSEDLVLWVRPEDADRGRSPLGLSSVLGRSGTGPCWTAATEPSYRFARVPSAWHSAVVTRSSAVLHHRILSRTDWWLPLPSYPPLKRSFISASSDRYIQGSLWDGWGHSTGKDLLRGGISRERNETRLCSDFIGRHGCSYRGALTISISLLLW